VVARDLMNEDVQEPCGQLTRVSPRWLNAFNLLIIHMIIDIQGCIVGGAVHRPWNTVHGADVWRVNHSPPKCSTRSRDMARDRKMYRLSIAHILSPR
jgi:hypothetical protein